MLSFRDPVTWNPRRVVIAGVSGTGETTLARRVESALDIPHTELDGLFHGPGWQPRPSFRADVETLVAGEAWVAEWQYQDARPLLLARVDTFVWLDLPTWLSMFSLVRRTLRRALRRELLWNGNVEPPLWTVLTDQDHVIRWGYRSRHKLRGRVPALALRRPELHVVRLRSQREVDEWVARLAPGCP